MKKFELKHKLYKIFQGVIKNLVSLGNDSTLESNLKPLKIGEKNTPIELSEDGVNISGTLKVNHIAVQTGSDANTITALNNATANRIVTVGATTTELDAEANLIFTGSALALVGTQRITSTTASQFLIRYDSSNYVDFNVASTGALEISTVGAGTYDSHMTLDLDGNLFLEPRSAVFLVETSDSAGDEAGYGQIWIKSDTPNNLCFTDDGGNDFKSIHLTPFVLNAAFQDDIGTVQHYIPFNSTSENTIAGNESSAFVAPFTMKLNKVIVRCNQDLSGGNCTIGMWAINSGTTHTHHHTTGKNWVRVTGGAADTNALFDFTGSIGLALSGSGGSNVISAGQMVDFSIAMDSDETNSSAEFWLTFFFTVDMSSTV